MGFISKLRALKARLRLRKQTTPNIATSPPPASTKTSTTSSGIPSTFPETSTAFFDAVESLKMLEKRDKVMDTYTKNNSNNKSEQDMLPDVKDWPHRPVLVTNTNGGGVTIPAQSHRANSPALPLDVPIDIESSLFKGQLILRLRNAISDDPENQKAYFEGRRRLFSVTVQGRFKKRVAMDDVNMGSRYSQPMKFCPPKFIMGTLKKVLRAVSPGLILDLRSDHPKIMGLLGGTVQSIRMDNPGEEPDIATILDVEENLLQKLKGSDAGKATPKHRKNILSVPSKASQYYFDTDHVYTFDQYDHMMDFTTLNLSLPGGMEVDLTETTGQQPVSLCAMMVSTGEPIYDVTFWHERTMPKKEDN